VKKPNSFTFKVQEIVSNEVPMFPLWYPANMVVFNKRIGNIKIGASGDWSFLKDITVEVNNYLRRLK
jgi:ABC-type transport system substrate-binding protein